jgi:hypothetical protein
VVAAAAAAAWLGKRGLWGAACCFGRWPGPPSFTKVGEINLTNVGRL